MSGDATLIASLASRGWVSLNGFSKLIGVAYPTALRMRDRGEVNVVQVGGVFRVYDNEVRRFLKEGNATPDPDGTLEGNEGGAKTAPPLPSLTEKDDKDE